MTSEPPSGGHPDLDSLAAMATQDQPRWRTGTGRWMSEHDLDALAAEYAPGGSRRAEVDRAIEQWIADTVAQLDSDDPTQRRGHHRVAPPTPPTMTRHSEDDDLAQHIIDTQINPQVKARELQDDGVNADTQFVYTGPDALDGHVEVTCAVCRRTAQLTAAYAPPAGTVIVCPRCIDTLDEQ